MRARSTPLPEMAWTSMIDIIFQLMIFFLVTLSVMPSIKSAPQVEGSMNLPTPKQGDSEVSLLVQLQPNPDGGMDYIVLQGNDQSAEFYNWFDDKRGLLASAATYRAFKNFVRQYNVVFDLMGLKALLMELSVNDPAVLIRAPGNIPYGEVVSITSEMHNLGISKIAWVKGSLSDVKVEIKKSRR